MTAVPEPLPLFDGQPYFERKSHFETFRHAPDDALEAVVQCASRLKGAQARFDDAVTAARRAGYSWRRIGTAAGVPFQSLHRRSAAVLTGARSVRDDARGPRNSAS
jgi:hypothetical protein